MLLRQASYKSAVSLLSPFRVPIRKRFSHCVVMRSVQRRAFDHEVDNAFLTSTAAATHSVSSTRLHLIALNYTLPSFTEKLWDVSSVRVFGDGGANRFYDLLSEMHDETEVAELRLKYLPDAICGDLDSIRPEILRFYKGMDVPVRDLSHDQDSTDTDKCIEYVKEHVLEDEPKSTICLLGSLGGRLDHTLANLHSAHTYADLDLVLFGEGNCARLLKKGKTKIQVDPDVEGPKCALVPLNGPVTVTATGLQWPLENHMLQFDGLISTSNAMVRDVVVVETDGPIVWITRVNESAVLDKHQGTARD